MKKLKALLLIFASLSVGLIGCNSSENPSKKEDETQKSEDPKEQQPQEIKVSGVSLNKNTVTLTVDETDTLVATVAPSDAANKAITWSSSNNEVATVNGGVITAKSAGTADVTVTTTDGSFTATCAVTVNAKPLPDPVQNPGVISLTGECHPTYSKSAYALKYGDYNFELQNTSDYADGYITLSKGGYIFNTTPFGDIDSFKVEYSVATPSGTQVQSDLGFGSLYYTTDSHEISSPRSYKRQEVSNNSLVTLSDNPNYISFYTYNEIDIKSITINYSTTATYSESKTDFDINLFATNDIHGQVNPDDTHAGLVNASGYIESQKGTYNMLFDQGDIYQGSLACYLTGGHVMDDYLLMNGYDSTILGNHEWDWMEANIREHRAYAPYVKLLACNVRYKDGTTPDWVQNYYITQRGGVKIGVIGALGDIAGDISADMIENIKFLVDDSSKQDYTLTNMISGFADELKQKGCDFVVLQVHAGSNKPSSGTDPYIGKASTTLEPNYTEIDYSKLKDKIGIVLESHSHKSYYHVDQYNIPHIQCGGYLSGMGKVTLGVTYTSGKANVAIKNVYLANATTLKGKSSSFFNDVNEWYSENVYKAESERVVATIPSQMNESEINQLAANAYYDLKNVYPELSSYTVSVGGGHINCRSPKKLATGNVTMSDVTNLFPFDNEMYLVKIKGKDLKYNLLNPSGNVLAGPMNASSTTTFSQYYYAIIDSYNFFYLTKQRTPNDPITVEVNLTEKYGIHPREAVAMYLTKTYPVKDGAQLQLKNTNFDFANTTFTMPVKDSANLTISYSNVVNNADYNQFNVKSKGGTISFVAPTGYKITSVTVDQYQTYTNLKFYSDSACENNITYTVGTGVYTMENTTDTFVIKNPSNYDVKINSVTLVIEKGSN